MTVSITGLSCSVGPQWAVNVTNTELLRDFRRIVSVYKEISASMKRLISSFDSIVYNCINFSKIKIN